MLAGWPREDCLLPLSSNRSVSSGLPSDAVLLASAVHFSGAWSVCHEPVAPTRGHGRILRANTTAIAVRQITGGKVITLSKSKFVIWGTIGFIVVVLLLAAARSRA